MQSKCPSVAEWLKKMQYIYTMEYYSAIIKNKIMPFSTTWMDLETIILNGLNHREEDTVYDIPYM